MLRLIRKVLFGLRTQGPKYLISAPVNEFKHPRLAVTRGIRRAVTSVTDLGARARGPQRRTADALTFVYDLSVSPLTFDFISYLAAAELTRRRAGVPHIDLVFIKGPHDGVRKEQADYEAAIGPDQRLWRLRNILVPALSLLPTVRGYSVCASREEAEAVVPPGGPLIYPTDYRLGMPAQPVKSRIHDMVWDGDAVWPMLRAGEEAKRYVASFLEKHAAGRRPVVISFRGYGYSPVRNSKVEDWLRFATGLDSSKYAPIIVPDTATAMTNEPADFGGLPICLAASWNLEIRMALYEAAWLNMGTMHGPLELCWFNETCRYAIFMATGADRSQDALTEHGHRIGADLDFATPYQHIVWSADEFSAISAAFAAMEPALPDVAGAPPAAR